MQVEAGASKPEPLSDPAVKRGATLLRAMFGDKKIARNSSVSDSRQLGKLAAMLANPETLTLIEQGKSVDEIELAVQPIDEKLRLGIEQVRETLRDLISRMAEVDVHRDLASSVLTPAEKAASLGQTLLKKLQEAAKGSSE